MDQCAQGAIFIFSGAWRGKRWRWQTALYAKWLSPVRRSKRIVLGFAQGLSVLREGCVFSPCVIQISLRDQLSPLSMAAQLTGFFWLWVAVSSVAEIDYREGDRPVDFGNDLQLRLHGLLPSYRRNSQP